MISRRLVVSADDFGATAGVNEAVLRAHRDGVLTNASLMVTAPAASNAVEVARGLPDLGVGLHLVLLKGVPAASRDLAGPLLGANGRFPDAPIAAGLRYAWRALSRRGATALRAEVAAQLAAFAATGLPLSHVDGHLHLHLHPMVLPILLDLAPRFGIRAMRVPREPLARALGYDGRHVVRRTFEAIVFSALGRWAGPRLRAAGIRTPDRVFGLHRTGAVDADYLLHLLADLPDGTTEVYCHPSTAGGEPGDRGTDELAGLIDPAVREAVRARGVELVSYRALTS